MDKLLDTFQLVFDQLDIAFSVVDPKFTFKYCNSAMAELLGDDIENIVGQTQYNVLLNSYQNKKGVNIETDDIHAWLIDLEDAQKQHNERDFITDTVDGRYFRVYRVSKFDGYHFLFALDITELTQTQKQLEEAINVSKHLATDELTGIMNRRAIMEKLTDEFNRSKRYNEPFAILVIDIDHFKNVNDSYGHLFGDTVIKHVAATCHESLRDTDYLGRFGGEEFIALLPKADQKSAIKVAERIRKLVETSSVEYDKDENINVTVSIGLSEYRSADNEITDVMKRADDRLYIAKNNGRNQVIAANSEENKLG